jgi:hypothetical protein
MRGFGYTGLAPKGGKEYQYPLEPVSFSNHKHLIATFLTREATETLARRGESAPLPLRLHAIFLDSGDGTLRARREWSISKLQGGVIPTGNGNLAVIAPPQLMFYSAALDPINQIGLREGDFLSPILSSPSGGAILLSYEFAKPEFQRTRYGPIRLTDHVTFRWIDTHRMCVTREWSEDGYVGVKSISDEALAVYRNPALPLHSEVLIGHLDGPRRTVCSSCGFPKFVKAEGPHELKLISTTGEVLFTQAFRQNEGVGWGRLRSSPDGRRFAMPLWQYKGGSALLDIASREVLKSIVVFDIPSRRWVYTLDAKEQKIKTVDGLALSPDGALMAILTDGIVQVYRLPATGSPPPGEKGS